MIHSILCILLHTIYVLCLDCKLHVEDRTVVVLVFMPAALLQGLFEPVIALDDEDTVLLQELVALAVLVPVGDHWRRFARLSFKEGGRWALDTDRLLLLRDRWQLRRLSLFF